MKHAGRLERGGPRLHRRTKTKQHENQDPHHRAGHWIGIHHRPSRIMTTREAFQQISTAMNAAVISQENVVERLLIAILANGHVLMEGLPGMAKTRAIETLSKRIESDFSLVR
jgi:hypothetical protein